MTVFPLHDMPTTLTYALEDPYDILHALHFSGCTCDAWNDTSQDAVTD